MRLAEQRADVRCLNWRRLPLGGVIVASSPIVSCSGLQRGDVHFGHVVAQRPHQFRDDDFGSRRHAAIAGRIDLEEPHLPGGVAYREPGVTPSFLAPMTVQLPAPARWSCRALSKVLHRHGARAHPIREPGRVRHLVQRVDVLRADVRRPVARPGERVLERVVDQVDVALATFDASCESTILAIGSSR